MKLILGKLNDIQIEAAKKELGPRTKPTHILILESHGHIVGTEKHCRKYFDTWTDIYKSVISESFETNSVESPNSYKSNHEIGEILYRKSS